MREGATREGAATRKAPPSRSWREGGGAEGGGTSEKNTPPTCSWCKGGAREGEGRRGRMREGLEARLLARLSSATCLPNRAIAQRWLSQLSQLTSQAEPISVISRCVSSAWLKTAQLGWLSQF